MIQEKRGPDGSFERKDYGSPLSWSIAFAVVATTIISLINRIFGK